MLIKKGLCIFGTVLAMMLGGCDSTDDSGSGSSSSGGGTPVPDPILITVSGTLAPHPISAAINTAVNAEGVPTQNFTLSWGEAGDIFIQIVSPEAVLENPTGFTALAEGDLDITTCNALTLECTWSFDEVDISALDLGLVALVWDKRATPDFDTTNVGLFGSGTAASLQAANGAVNATGLSGYAVSVEARTNMATLSAASGDTATTYDAATMLANGYLFGLMLDNTVDSDGAPDPSPLYGVMTTNQGIVGNINTFYPTTAMTGLGDVTGGAGFFFGVASSAAPHVNSWTACYPDATTENATDCAESANYTWAGLTAGTNPGTAFVLNWVADAAAE
ncbi:MAG: hypothetical protein QGG84_08015 [Rhodospirillales bacterium]|nr:hypothetical protein [Rhodospirillales bacterium]